MPARMMRPGLPGKALRKIIIEKKRKEKISISINVCNKPSTYFESDFKLTQSFLDPTSLILFLLIKDSSVPT